MKCSALVLLLIGINASASNQVGNMGISPGNFVDIEQSKVGNLQSEGLWKAVAVYENSILFQLAIWNGTSWETRTQLKNFDDIEEALLVKIRRYEVSVFNWNKF